MEVNKRILTSTTSTALVQPYVKVMVLDFCKNHNFVANLSIDEQYLTHFSFDSAKCPVETACGPHERPLGLVMVSRLHLKKQELICFPICCTPKTNTLLYVLYVNYISIIIIGRICSLVLFPQKLGAQLAIWIRSLLVTLLVSQSGEHVTLSDI